MNPPMIGHRLSVAANAMAVVTISAGAMYATYDTPPSTSVARDVRSTSEPTPTPRTEQVQQRLDDRSEHVADPQPPEHGGMPERHANWARGCHRHG